MVEILRDCIEDETAWRNLIADLRQKLDVSRSNLADQVTNLGRLGDHLRLSPDAREEAVQLLQSAIDLALHLGYFRAVAVNRIRLGTALQYSGQHEHAVAEFRQAIALIESRRIRRLKDFALQHMGKCLAEMGCYAEARKCLKQALRLRQRRGNQSLADSTLRALKFLDEIGTDLQP